MPIKPENKKLYPKNWKEIRQNILQRANNKCEFCGISNYAVGYRDYNGNFVKVNEYAENVSPDVLYGEKIIKIVLTIAHLDHNPQNNNPENLKALCQKCHLNYDLEHHLESRKKKKGK